MKCSNRSRGLLLEVLRYLQDLSAPMSERGFPATTRLYCLFTEAFTCRIAVIFRLFSKHLLTVQMSIKHFSNCLICYSVYSLRLVRCKWHRRCIQCIAHFRYRGSIEYRDTWDGIVIVAPISDIAQHYCVALIWISHEELYTAPLPFYDFWRHRYWRWCTDVIYTSALFV